MRGYPQMAKSKGLALNSPTKIMDKEICRYCKKNEAQIHGICKECCDCCQDQDPPMGVSEWMKHGKKYGYLDYFDTNFNTRRLVEGMITQDLCRDCRHDHYNEALQNVVNKLKEL